MQSVINIKNLIQKRIEAIISTDKELPNDLIAHSRYWNQQIVMLNTNEDLYPRSVSFNIQIPKKIKLIGHYKCRWFGMMNHKVCFNEVFDETYMSQADHNIEAVCIRTRY